MDVRDGPVRRVAWGLAIAADRLLGPRAARRAARIVGAVEGLSDAGVHRVALRVSPRLARANPGLVKVSAGWAGVVRVRRQGMEFELDLPDNLQAVLYYAGRYGDGAVVQEVSVVRLDDWAREHSLDRLDVVKMDIEGAEIAALTGATRTLKRLQPRALLVEDKRSESSARLHAVLDELGYRPTGEVLDHNAVFRPELRA